MASFPRLYFRFLLSWQVENNCSQRKMNIYKVHAKFNLDVLLVFFKNLTYFKLDVAFH